MHACQQGEVAVGGGGIGTVGGIVIVLKGFGGLTAVAVDAAQKVVGTHLLVGRAVTVVVVGGRLQPFAQRVHRHIRLVHRVGTRYRLPHFLGSTSQAAATYGEQHGHNKQ